jgi:methylmalonyl-CoA mutase C-terminal domain/subunit
VIYTGLHQTPEQIVEAAVQEDVDVVALSILSGAHMTLFPEVRRLMEARGIGDRLLTGGGIIPPEDMESLARQGVGRLFGPGTSTQEIAAYIHGWSVEKHGAGAVAPLSAAPATHAAEMVSAAELAHHAPRPARPLPARPRKKPPATAAARKPAPRPARPAAARRSSGRAGQRATGRAAKATARRAR